MSLASTPPASLSRDTGRASAAAAMPLPSQVGMLAWRALVVTVRVPAAVVPSLAISLFTLFVYQGQFGGVAGVFLRGGSYLGFLLPLALLSATLSGAGVAGQVIVRDIERGYFDKLSLTPASRWALLLGPMLAGAVALALQAAIIILVALLLGLRSETSLAGLLAVGGLAVLVGVAFSGLMVGVALLTGNAAATQGVAFLFFPLTLLTATFVPVDRLQGWIRVAARVNPITYLLEPMRATLNTGWDGPALLRGLAVGLLMLAVLFAVALYGLGARTRRR